MTRPLLGRDDELTTAIEAIGNGRPVVVRGPQGVGRTAFGSSLATILRRRRIPVADILDGQTPDTHNAVLLIDDPARCVGGALDRLLASPTSRFIVGLTDGQPLTEETRRLVSRSDVAVITLSALSPLLTRQLAEQVAGQSFTTGAADTVFHLSGGLPLFVVDLIEAAQRDDLLDPDHDYASFIHTPRFSEAARFRIDLVLEALPRHQRDALEVLALTGPLPEHHAVAAIGLDPLTELEQAGLVTADADGVDVASRPARHHLVSEMPRLRARAILEAVCSTISATDDTPTGAALDLMRAAHMGEPIRNEEVAVCATAFLEMADSWRAAALLDLVPEGERTASIDILRARALLDMGSLAAAGEAFNRARGRAVDGMGTEAALGLARVALIGGDTPTALRLLDEAEHDATTDEVRLLVASARLEFTLFDREWTLVSAAAEALEAQAPDRSTRHIAQTFRGLARCFTGPLSAAGDAFPAGSAGLPASVACWLHFGRYSQHLAEGDLAAALEVAESGRAEAVAGRAGTHAGMMLGTYAAALSWTGDIDAALEAADIARRELDRADPAGFASLFQPFDAYLRCFAGDRSGAAASLARFEATTSGRRSAGNSLRSYLWLAVLSGDLEQANQLLAEISQVARDMTPGWGLVGLHDGVRLGLEKAVDLGLMEQWALQLGGAFSAAMTDHARGVIHGQREPIVQAAQVFEERGYHLHAAEAWAHALQIDPSGSIGVEARVALARNELRCPGARTPGLRRAPSPLTSREEQIAYLASDGHTNQSIAELLGVSRRTVENHLQRAFAKLGVSRRTQLEEALAND